VVGPGSPCGPGPTCRVGEALMFEWIHLSIPPAPAMFAQLLVGLINGAFYAMLSLGLAVIFGRLRLVSAERARAGLLAGADLGADHCRRVGDCH